jgi:hypothetical protein
MARIWHRYEPGQGYGYEHGHGHGLDVLRNQHKFLRSYQYKRLTHSVWR